MNLNKDQKMKKSSLEKFKIKYELTPSDSKKFKLSKLFGRKRG